MRETQQHTSLGDSGLSSTTCNVTGEADENEDDRPFPTLRQALTHVDEYVGFNVEIKYPMMQQNGELECGHFLERNEYVDLILADVLTFANERRIVFSSFDPDICTLVNLKQNKYPILFLCLGNTTIRYMPFIDQRSNCIDIAVSFAASSLLLGLNFHSEDLLHDSTPTKKANDLRLVSFVWGDDLDVPANIIYFKKTLGVDGIVYDRIGEFGDEKRNVFVVEKERGRELFKKTSRSPSIERIEQSLSSSSSEVSTSTAAMVDMPLSTTAVIIQTQ